MDMITKYRTPCRRCLGLEDVKEVEFARETDKCLFDAKGRKTLKRSDWEMYHDTREQAQAHINSLMAEHKRKDSDERIRKAAPQLLEALELAREFISNGIELGYIRMPDQDTPDSAHKTLPLIDAAIAAAKGE
jgi:hypothetical protein